MMNTTKAQSPSSSGSSPTERPEIEYTREFQAEILAFFGLDAEKNAVSEINITSDELRITMRAGLGEIEHVWYFQGIVAGRPLPVENSGEAKPVTQNVTQPTKAKECLNRQCKKEHDARGFHIDELTKAKENSGIGLLSSFNPFDVSKGEEFRLQGDGVLLTYQAGEDLPMGCALRVSDKDGKVYTA